MFATQRLEVVHNISLNCFSCKDSFSPAKFYHKRSILNESSFGIIPTATNTEFVPSLSSKQIRQGFRRRPPRDMFIKDCTKPSFNGQIRSNLIPRVKQVAQKFLYRFIGADFSRNCDSFVGETDIHYPTNINLPFDAIRKTIILIMCLYGQLNIGGVMSSL